MSGMSQGDISKVLHHVRATSSLTQGLRGHRLKVTTSKEGRVLHGVMEEDRFLLASRSKDRGTCRADQASLHGPKTFSSGWISPKTSRQIHHTWLSPHATRIGTQSSKLEQWALVSFDICWWFQSQSLPLSSPVSWMQQCTSLSTAWQNIRARISQFHGLTMDSSASIRWLKMNFYLSNFLSVWFPCISLH